jgi:hypothetical protein
MSIDHRVINECGIVGGMRIGRGNQSAWKNPVSVPFCPPQMPHDLHRLQRWKPVTNHLSSVMAQL